MTDEALLVHVSDIVSAHVSNNSVAADALPGLIESVYSSLANLGVAPEPVEEKRSPAVSVRSSVKPDAVTCLECGAKLTMLKRHLSSDHGLTASEYRARWNLPADYPLVAPNYTVKRKELAARIGLGRKPAKSAPAKAAPAKSAKAKASADKAATPVAAKVSETSAAVTKQRKPRKKLGVAF